MEKFQEKEIKDLASVKGGIDANNGEVVADSSALPSFTISWKNFFNWNLFSEGVDEFDKPNSWF